MENKSAFEVSKIAGNSLVYDKNSSIHRCFSRVAARYPDRIALSCCSDGNSDDENNSGEKRSDPVQLSYRELDEISSLLAAYLVDKGIKKGDPVALVLDKGTDFIAGVLGVLKAGGCYVPIDPEYPAERIRLMLDASLARVVLSEQKHLASLSRLQPQLPVECYSVREILAVADNSGAGSRDWPPVSGADPAYLIFTSGTSGRPKGVLNRHSCVINLCAHYRAAFGIGSEEKCSQIPSFSFDASVGEIFSCLLAGGHLVVFPSLREIDPADMLQKLLDNRITFTTFSPTLLKLVYPALNPATVASLAALKTMIIGGEPLLAETAQQWLAPFAGKVRFFNIYGPTETTVFSTFHELSRAAVEHLRDGVTVPIGKPICNTEIYIAGENQRPLPAGEWGEICIGGAGVAAGYYRQAQLTAERFIVAEFAPGRFYRSGDLGRINADGELEIAGRCDSQIKINGVRIEPGEIEQVIKRHPAVAEAIVVCARNQSGNQCLAAFVLYKTGADGESPAPAEDLPAFLARHLPAALQPSKLIPIAELPMTTSGKVDRSRLPTIDWSAPQDRAIVPPKDEREALLVEAWMQVLHQRAIGRDDNFYRLGGDSISSLRLASWLKQRGYRLTQKQIMTHPLLCDLAAVMESCRGGRVSGAWPVSGPCKLAPMQRWFFAQHLPRPHYYHQSMEFDIEQPVDARLLAAAFDKVLAHHDQLRAQFLPDAGGGYRQEINASLKPLQYCYRDLSLLAPAEQRQRLQALGEKLRAAVSLERAPLARLGIFKRASDSYRVVCVIHHLLVDTVSWQIIAADFYRAWCALTQGREVKLSEKTDSYAAWVDRLCRLYGSDTQDRADAIAFWQSTIDQIQNLIPPLQQQSSQQQPPVAAATVCRHKIVLPEERTRMLIAVCCDCYNTTAEELIMAALYRALALWSQKKVICIDIEWHGRQEAGEIGLDVSGTVGWFTAIYPLLLALDGAESPRETIVNLKEKHRRIPQRGVSYNALRFLGDALNVPPDFSAGGQYGADMVFNFSGVVQQQVGDWCIVPISAVETAPENATPYPIAFESYIDRGTLVTDVYFQEDYIGAADVASIGRLLLDQLETIVNHCGDLGNAARTPSDFSACELTMDDIQALPENTRDLIPLSNLQQGIYFHHLTDKNSRMYQVQVLYRMQLPLHRETFFRAFDYLIERHDILRTQIVEMLGDSMQLVVDSLTFKGDYLDVSPLADDAQTAAIQAKMDEYGKRRINLAKAPLLRLCLIETADAHSFKFLLDIHHIIHDGWSLVLLMDELKTVYKGLLAGREPRLPAVVAHFRDYVLAQKEVSADPQEMAFWKRKISGLIPTKLPYDRPRHAATDSGSQGLIMNAELQREACERLKKVAGEHQVTLNTLFLSAYVLLLKVLTRSDTVVLGVVTSGRGDRVANHDAIVGCCLNTLPLIVRFSDGINNSIGALLQTVQREIFELNEHMMFPLSDILQLAREDNDGVRVELFDCLYDFESYGTLLQRDPAQPEIVGGFEMTNYGFECNVFEQNGALSYRFTFDSRCFKAATARRWVACFEAVLRHIGNGNLDLSCSAAACLSSQEAAVLDTFSGFNAPYPQDKSIHHFIEQYARSAPERIAISCGDEALNYDQLNTRANRVAHHLLGLGLVPDSVVAVLLNRSIDMVVAIVGIWKAAAAYMPIDPDYPAGRIKTLLDKSAISLLISDARTCDTTINRKFSGSVVLIETLVAASETRPHSNPELPYREDYLSYVLFTSGSTGTPKGVMIEHRGMMNNIQSQINDFRLCSDSVVAQTASHCFDISVWQFFSAFVVGARTVIYPKALQLNPPAFIERCFDRDGTSVLQLVPSYIQEMLGFLQEKKHPLKSLEVLSITGEALTFGLLERWLSLYPEIPVINAYGPAEAADDITHHIFESVPADRVIPIGKPIQNNFIYIVDPHMQRCPIGVVGEICVSGTGVGRGYINDIRRTRQSFTRDPFRPGDHRLYRTGDMGRWREDGSLEFCGRIDHQVKINGFRIELGEIENALAEQPGVEMAAVIVRKSRHKASSLSAWVSLDRARETTLEAETLRDRLQKTLPSYMVPASIRIVDKVPLNRNGKVDRKQLQKMENEIRGVEPSLVPDGAMPAVSAGETSILEVWREVLGVETIATTDNFFDIGGQSLLAIRLVTRLSKLFNTEISVADIFANPTVSQQIRLLDKRPKMAFKPIVAVEKRDFYPVSAQQRRLYALQQMMSDSLAYNMPVIFSVRGDLDADRLENAFRQLIARHESLRTAFKIQGEKLVQVIYPQVEFDLDRVDDFDKHTGIEHLFRSFVKPFDLSRAPCVRVRLVRCADAGYVLLIDMHHIVADGVSTDILVEDLVRAYRGEKLAPLAIQYKDYTLWQTDNLNQENLKKQERYWLAQFEDGVPVLDLPGDYPRPALKSFKGGHYSFELGRELTGKVGEFCRRHQVTLYMLLLAVYKVLLARYSGQSDICVGSPVAGRDHGDTEEVVGMFVNTLALRSRPQADKTFSCYLREIKATVLGAFDHQHMPIEELLEKLRLTRDISRTPLFDVMFVMENKQQPQPQLPGVTLELIAPVERMAKFDLLLAVLEDSESIGVHIEYYTAIFKAETIERFAAQFRVLLEDAIDHADKPLAALNLLPEAEQRRLLTDFNATAEAFDRAETIQTLFEKQVLAQPEKDAVVFENQSLSYRELNRRANHLANLLRQLGVEPEQVVGLMVERSIEMIVGILGVIKAGAAYLPISHEYPGDRIRNMLDETGARILLVHGLCFAVATKLELNQEILHLDFLSKHLPEYPNPEPRCDGDSLAYIIYTSGSTGKPKGVMIEHKSIVNLCLHFRAITSCEDRCAQMAPFAFDASAGEIYTALLRGATLHILPKAMIDDIRAFEGYVDKNAITFSAIAPPYLANINPDTLPGLKKVLAAGSRSNPEVIEKWRNRGTTYINAYGPTETTVISTQWRSDRDPPEQNLIGKPIENTRVYILGTGNRLQPIGVGGEICIAGAGVARGYVNNESLTRERFIENPCVAGEIIYRTGDLGRWHADGNLEFLGRLDDQVKVRGYRIEPGEIEIQTLQHPCVVACAVSAREDERGSVSLCLYYVERNNDIAQDDVRNSEEKNDTAQNAGLSGRALREYLGNRLPAYMIPAYFVKLDALPLTTNGKVDKKALPEPGGIMDNRADYEAPRNSLEQVLVTAWEDVLSAEGIGIGDNFFTLGGDSIKAIQIAARLNTNGYKLEIANLFQYPQIKRLSAHISTLVVEIDQNPVHGFVPFTPIQHWFAAQRFTQAHHWNQSTMLYRLQGFDADVIRAAFKALLDHHDMLRASVSRQRPGCDIHPLNSLAVPLKVVNLRAENAVGEGNPGKNDVGKRRVDKKTIEERVIHECNACQASLDLFSAPLIGLTLFHCEDGDHLLIVIHHMLVDGVSWRVLLEDFIGIYQQIEAKTTPVLPSKTHSFKAWSQALLDYSRSPTLAGELDYWRAIGQRDCLALPVATGGRRSISESGECEMQLDADQTAALLHNTHGAYNTDSNDILLAALSLAMGRWLGPGDLRINLEGHGREALPAGLDISRTVGWFTSQFPVVLELEDLRLDEPGLGDPGLARVICRTKEVLRKVPRKGIGYGVLRYLGTLEGEELRCLETEPDVSFNYLGQFEHTQGDDSITLSRFSSGEEMSPAGEQVCPININGWIRNSTLSFSFSYDSKTFDHGEVETLAADFGMYLRAIIVHCSRIKETVRTLSDFSAADLDFDDLHIIERSCPGPIEDIHNPTSMQKGILYHYLLDKNRGDYNVQHILTLHGEVDAECLQRSFNMLADRHQALRMVVLHRRLKKPRLVVLSRREIEFTAIEPNTGGDTLPTSTATGSTVGGRMPEVADVQGCTSAVGGRMPEVADVVQETAQRDWNRGFELDCDSPIRVTLIQTGSRVYKLLMLSHHIAMDGWCIGPMFNELLSIYRALKNRRRLQLEPAAPYGNYLNWLQTRDKARALEYWKTCLQGYDSTAIIPYRKKDAQCYEVREWQTVLSARETRLLTQLAQAEQVTVNTIFQVIWALVLQTYNDTRDVVVGNVISGRPADLAGVEKMLGLFINTVPLRVKTQSECNFNELLRQVQMQFRRSETHGYVSLAEIKKAARIDGDWLDHVYVFENYPSVDFAGEEAAADTGFSIAATLEGKEQYPYDFNILIIPDTELNILFSYNKHAIGEQAVKRMAGHIKRVIDQVLENPQRTISSIDLLTDAESQLLQAVNDTQKSYLPDTHHTLQRLFEQRVAEYPEDAALVYEGESVSYGALNRRCNQLAARLRDKGVGPDKVVGVMVERSIEMVVAILSILKAGGAYLPIDPSLPAERIGYMLEDSGCQLLLAQSASAGRSRHSTQGCEVVNLDDAGNYSGVDENPHTACGADNLAYVIFTSGSTGRPKGVMIEHRAVTNLFLWSAEHYHIGRGDVMLQKTVFTFDFSVWELFLPLVTGGTLVLMKQGDEKYPAKILDAIIANDVTTVNFVPSVLSAFLKSFDTLKNQPRSRLRLCFCSGEALKPSHKTLFYRVFPGAELHNLYGPTEAAVEVCHYPVAEQDRTILIGKPVANTRLYILNQELNFMPLGIPGELYIGGVQLARGYANRPDLTREKFIQNPFGEGRLYRTGDLAQWREDGNIEYLGRIDNQVKIRGYRIELEEIEVCIQSYAGIREAVVATVEDADDLTGDGSSLSLCTYFVADNELETAPLREWVRNRLPLYMVPSYFVQIDHIPLSGNGKADRKKLPRPDRRSGLGSGYTPPRDSLEETLQNIWEKVLGKENISVVDNFFDIGGNSLNAINIVALMEKAGLKIFLRDVFKNGDIRSLAQACHSRATAPSKAGGVARDADPVPLPAQVDIDAVAEALHESLSQQCKWFSDSICLSPQRKKFPLSPIQQLHFQLGDRLSGGLVPLSGYFDEARLLQAVRALITSQGLLRSRCVREGGCWFWREHTGTERLPVPLADVSGYATPSRAALIRSIAMRITADVNEKIAALNREDDSAGLLYRLLLVKENQAQYTLIFAADHLIADARSLEIVADEIAQHYHRQAQQVKAVEGRGTVSGATDYASYVSRVAQGPRGISPAELIGRFSLRRYRTALKKWLDLLERQRGVATVEVQAKIRMGKTGSDGAVDPLTLSLAVFTEYCRKHLGLGCLPITFLSDTRNVDGDDYHSVIGEFLDHIPYVWDFADGLSVAEHLTAFQALKTTAGNHNINFLALLGDPGLRLAWREAVDLIYPDSSEYLNGYAESLLRFNFQGEKPADERANDAAREGKGLNGLLFEAAYRDDWLYLTLETCLEGSAARMQRELERIAERWCEAQRSPIIEVAVE